MSEPEPGGEPALTRAITRPMLVLFVIGDILGAGIYALVGEVAGRVGGAIWASFLLALTLALLTAFSYTELVTRYPGAAGAALYVNRAFKRPFLTFIIAFAVMASGLASAATIARAFGGDYLQAFVSLPVVLTGLVFLLVITLINLGGIRDSMRFNVVLTLVELGGLLLVVVIGLAALAQGLGDPGRALDFKAGEAVPLAILSGAGIAFFAFIGFEDSVNLAEEAKRPRRDYPWAIFGGIAVAGTLYLIVVVVASMVVPTGQLAGSDGPLLEVTSIGPLAVPDRVFSAIALFALANGALINLIMASRLLYGMAGEGILSPVFGRVGQTRHTPWFSILFTATVAALLFLSGQVAELAETTVLLLLLAFAAVNLSVLVIRRRPSGGEADHFRVPTVIPILGFIACLVLIADKGADTFLRAGILLAFGAVLWVVNRAFGQEE